MPGAVLGTGDPGGHNCTQCPPSQGSQPSQGDGDQQSHKGMGVSTPVRDPHAIREDALAGQERLRQAFEVRLRSAK